MDWARWAWQPGRQHTIRDDTTYVSGDDFVHWVVERRLEGAHTRSGLGGRAASNVMATGIDWLLIEGRIDQKQPLLIFNRGNGKMYVVFRYSPSARLRFDNIYLDQLLYGSETSTQPPERRLLECDIGLEAARSVSHGYPCPLRCRDEHVPWRKGLAIRVRESTSAQTIT